MDDGTDPPTTINSAITSLSAIHIIRTKEKVRRYGVRLAVTEPNDHNAYASEKS